MAYEVFADVWGSKKMDGRSIVEAIEDGLNDFEDYDINVWSLEGWDGDRELFKATIRVVVYNDDDEFAYEALVEGLRAFSNFRVNTWSACRDAYAYA